MRRGRSSAVTPEQFAKMPRFVRWHIEKLQADLAYERTRLSTLLAPDLARRDALVVMDPYADAPIPLPNDARVAFKVGGAWIHVFRRGNPRGDRLCVYSDLDRLVVEPGSASSIACKGDNT